MAGTVSNDDDSYDESDDRKKESQRTPKPNSKPNSRYQIGERVRIEAKHFNSSIPTSRHLPQLGTIVNVDVRDGKPIIKFHDDNCEAKLSSRQKIVHLIKAWLSSKIRVDEFNNKEQAFVITAWINVFWKIEDNDESKFNVLHSPTIARHKSGPKLLFRFRKFADTVEVPPASPGCAPLTPLKIKTSENHTRIANAKTICYTNNLGHKIIKILDLRESSLSYFLPIDATKIFFETSLQFIHHNDPPCLYYNQKTKLLHTQYHIKAKLFEHLELHDFPFDRQFLNIKLRWNTMYYHLLNWSNESERMLPIVRRWWDDDKNTILSEKRKTLYHTHPLTIHLSEALRSEIFLLEPWIDFRCKQIEKNKCNENDIDLARFALIRLRIKRNPTNFVLNVLVPFFIIVSSCFSVFAMEWTDIGERLSVSIIILLTFTAFRDMVNEELPKTSETELIDKYILMAYCIQGLVIFAVTMIPTFIAESVDPYTLDMIHKTCPIIPASIWVIFSLYYISKIRHIKLYNHGDGSQNEYDFILWQKRAKQEMESWMHTDTVTTSFYNLDGVEEHRQNNKDELSKKQTPRTSIYQNNVGYGATGWMSF